MTVRVCTDLEAYRVAVAELPASSELAASAAGSIVVVRGDGHWWTIAADAIGAGAAAVVVAGPGSAPVDALEALAASAGGIPVLLDRPLLRPDMVRDVSEALADAAPAAALVVECHAPAAALRATLREAVGWARVVAGAPLALRTSESSGRRVLALLSSETDAAVSVVAAAQPGAPALGRVRITTIAEKRIEIDAGLEAVVTVADAGGDRILPTRFEARERVALRRAVAAVRAGQPSADLADLRHDMLLGNALLGPAFS
ncbi:MAG: hypothetical protein ACTHNQ_13095 [Microbacterium sp.]|uniref:hypothetical protein n=1 Tax=Microbacterium sp. TaxID=51671 RepID=UPI003F7DE68F